MIGKTNAQTSASGGIKGEKVNIFLKTNQSSHEDLKGAIITVSYATVVEEYIWSGNGITVEIPPYINYSVYVSSVEGYASPASFSSTSVPENSKSVELEYKTEIVSVTLSADDGSSVYGASVTINGKSYTWDGNAIIQKVAFGVSYNVSAGALSGFGQPSSQSFTAGQALREVSFVYVASALKVNILSNQSDDDVIADVKATVAYGSTTFQVGNGEQVGIPTNTEIIITYPEVEGYKTPQSESFTSSGGLLEKTVTYQTEVLTVNVSADNGTPTGYEITISKQETVGVATKYTKLEYIESNGTQYIDTGFKHNQDTRVVMNVQPTASSLSSNVFLFDGASGNTTRKGVFYHASASKWAVDYKSDSNRQYISNTATNANFIIDYDKNVCTINNETITFTASTFQSTVNMALFATNYNGTVQAYVSAKLYSCQIYDNGILIRDFVPALRSDGIAGLYDAINDKFYVSSGSGNFIASSDNNEVVAVQTTVTGTYKIPFGYGYKVSASSIEGFDEPEVQTFIADRISRVVNVSYIEVKKEILTVNVKADDNSSVDRQNVTVVSKPFVDNGVYIQDTEGKLWTESAWDGLKTPNGIAVVTSECQFVMALKDTSNSTLYWGGNGVKIEGISSPNTASDANANYNGASNTDIIIKSLNGVTDSYSTGAPAAESCRNFIFPNGQKGYLGACGEWRAIYVNLSAVTSALSKCDGEALEADYSSSTQSSSTQYWYMRLRGTYTDTGSSTKSSPKYVRAFAPLETTETQPVSGGKATFKIPYDTEYTVSVDEKSGYTSPASQTYTASQATRTISMTYEAPKNETLTVNVSASDGSSVDGQVVTVKQQGIANGVYIEDINGKLWTEAEWNGSVTPNGVAVITDECQFVMALEDVDAQYWAPNYAGVPGAFLTNFLETAKTDYSGIVNTQKVIEKFSSDTSTAAYCCQNFIFPNGGKGYVGAVGEWQAVINNKDAIFSALSKCGAEDMVQTSSYWTSTMETAGRAWLGSLKNKTFTTDLVSKDYPVRAFTKLGSKPVTNGKATFTIPSGTTYEVSVSEKDGYATPASQTFTAGDGTRTISMQYIPMKITTIRINQTITDPTSMITRIVDKGGIEAVRANSHRYTGTFANGVMTLKQLSDTDGTKYKDGSTATLNSAGVDVWMRLPQFYWKCTQYATDQWDFSVAYDTKPDNSYKEWDGNDLIGVYEGYAVMSQLLSRSGENVSYESPSTFKDYARNRGEGYTLVKWKHHCMMAMLFYMQYGHTNAQNKIGPGNTTNKKTGGTDSLGMTDTVAGGNGSSGSINFWGLENWWGNYYEFIDNVIINARAWSITEDDGTVRAAGTGCSSNGWTTKMMFGDYMDLIPTIANASESTGFCDYYYQATSSNRVVARSWNSNSTNGGVAAVDCQYGTTSRKSSYGTRLAFRGKIKIVG